MKRQYQIQLTEEQRTELEQFCKTGNHSARMITRAKIILLLDTSENKQGITLAEIAKRLDVSIQTIQIVRRDYFAAENVSSFLKRKKRLTPPVAPKITGDVEAKIIALACSEVPAGFSKWTVSLITEKSVELNLGNTISRSSVHNILKKHNYNLT